jgi:3-hydroxyisobutyrate dehydrogenase
VNARTVAFAGLGRMGLPMAGRLASAGHTVIAYDANPRARSDAEALGVAARDSAAGAAAQADCLILMLPDSAVVSQVLFAEGALEALPPGSNLIDMGSSQPAESRRIASAAESRGVRFVDAPVSGGVPRAMAGTLTIMAGGDQDLIDELADVFSALGGPVRRVGPTGSGHALKAINNLLAGTTLLSAIEGLDIARRFGIDDQMFADVVNSSTGRSWSSEHKLPNYVIPEDYTAGFALSLLVKDMAIALDIADKVGARAPLAHAVVELWRAAQKTLPADADHTAVARWATRRT